MSNKETNMQQAIALITNLRDSLKSINGAFDKPFDEEIAQADAFLVSVGDQKAQEYGIKLAVIGPWDSSRYGHAENQKGPDFAVSINDNLKRNGQVFVNIVPEGGNVDDLLSTMVEVSNHPETGQPVPVVRVHRGDNCIANIYADRMDTALLVISRADLDQGYLRIQEG